MKAIFDYSALGTAILIAAALAYTVPPETQPAHASPMPMQTASAALLYFKR